MAENIKEKLCSLFEEVKDAAGFQPMVEAAKRLNFKSDPGEFLSSFLEMLRNCLVHPDKTSAEQMLLFTAKFTAAVYAQTDVHQNESLESDGEEDLFVSGLFNFIFKTHSATFTDARLRCVNLVNHILSFLPDGSWLPVSIWNGLTEMIRMRLQDRNLNVRISAVLVARKVQEPKNPDCEIMKLLRFHMTDAAPAVRRAVLSSIAICNAKIIGDVLGRTLDVNENVRRNAYAVLAKVEFKSLSISQRITLLERGLKDRSDSVRTCMESIVLLKWWSSEKNNAIALLERIDVVNCSELALKTLECLSKSISFDDMRASLPFNENDHVVPVEKLTPEVALLWRFLVFFAKKNDLEENLDTLIPNIAAFLEYVRRCDPFSHNTHFPQTDEEQWAEIERKRVFIHLLEIATCFDPSDEHGRRKLKEMCTNMLFNRRVGCQIVPYLLDILLIVSPGQEYTRDVIEIISEIREPLTQLSVEERMKLDVEIAKCRLALQKLRDEQLEAVECKNYTKAGELSVSIEELNERIASFKTKFEPALNERTERSDPETVSKCLKIINYSISASGLKQLNAELASQYDFIKASLENSSDLATQSLSIQALAKFCILDQEKAQSVLSFLLMMKEDGENDVNIPAVRAVFDILQYHGTDCVQGFPAKSDGDHTSVADILAENEDNYSSQYVEQAVKSPAAQCLAVLRVLLTTSKNDELKVAVFEGLSKLLVSGVVYSPSLLKTIIVKGFSPIRGSDAEDRIRQFFVVFFSIFARHTIGSQEMIEAAFIPVIRRLKDAEYGTAEADTNIRDVIMFLIDHTRPDINQFASSTAHIHNNLALTICYEILRDISKYPDVEPDRNYLRGLIQLNLSLDSEAYLQNLTTLIKKIKRGTKDASFLSLINQFHDKLLQNADAAAEPVSVVNTIGSSSQYSLPLTPLKQVSQDENVLTAIGSRSRNSKRKLIVPESPEQLSD